MLAGLRAAFPDTALLVVDDDSPDGTAGLVREFQQTDGRVELIVRTDKRGLGSAIVDAMRFAIASGYEFFINLDADLSHDPQQLPQLLELAVEDSDIDVVIGSRYIPGGKIIGWPMHRRMMSKMVNRFATAFLKLPVRDCSGSMRCYRTAALDALDLDSLECTGYALLEELLVRLNRAGGKLAEVPITFTERQRGQSKLTLSESLRSVRFMMRLAMTLRNTDNIG